MLLLIDNYDSFVHNLARYLVELGCETRVVRNDEVTLDEIQSIGPEAILLSPGPCTPEEAGICVDTVRRFSGQIPILGVCLGHQAIGAAFGASIIRANEPVHGRTSRIHHDGSSVFRDLPNPLIATRYHSLIVEESELPPELNVIARTGDKTPMAIAHETHLTVGTQFHPESVLTDHGHKLLASFLSMAGIRVAAKMPNAEWTPPSPDEADWPVVPF